MQYNLHPIIVHFPIALLFLYSVIKILPLSRWFPAVAWKHIERALLVFGVLGAFASLTTGEAAEEIARPNWQLVETHATFATLATWLYGALLVGEVLSLLNPILLPKLSSSVLKKTLSFVEGILCDRLYSRIIALLALLAISLTGLLGGVMVYGTSADPFAASVLKLLGISL
jgi:uncharacterized membrane protein